MIEGEKELVRKSKSECEEQKTFILTKERLQRAFWEGLTKKGSLFENMEEYLTSILLKRRNA